MSWSIGALVDAWGVAVVFGGCIVLLDWFDVSLPRGDSFGVSGALISSGFLVLDSQGRVLLGLVALSSVVVLYTLRHRGAGALTLEVSIGIRALAIAGLWASLLLVQLSAINFSDAIVAIFMASAYLGTELIATQTRLAASTKRPLGRLLRGNITRQTPIIAAQVSVSALVVITYPTMGAYGLVPVVAVLLLIRQSYAVLLQMRETYRTTVEVLVEAAEGQDDRLRGHADRTAHIAREICMRLGFSPSHVERASYAALLHDVDAIALSDEERDSQATGSSSLVLQDVEFLADVIPIMELCDGREVAGSVREIDVHIAMAVALAGEIDALRFCRRK
jgi:hypothetical protein